MNGTKIITKSTLIAMLALVMGACNNKSAQADTTVADNGQSRIDTMYVLRALRLYNNTNAILLIDANGNIAQVAQYPRNGSDALFASPNDTVLVDKKTYEIVKNLTLHNQGLKYVRQK